MENATAMRLEILAILLAFNFIIAGTGPLRAADDIVHADEGMLPDISSPRGIEIGGVRGEWGGVVKLSASGASFTDNGKCVFRYGLELMNSGSAPADEFGYRLNAVGWSAVMESPGIGAGERVVAEGEIVLNPGKQKVVIKLDNDEYITESDELNNVPFALRVDVDGKCETGDKGLPVLATNRSN